MARMRTSVCVTVGLLFAGVVLVGLAEERNDQGNQSPSAPFQTKQVFTGVFTIPIDGATFTKLASLDVSAYSSIRLERTVLDAPSPSLEVHVSVNRGGCPLDPVVGCIISSQGILHYYERFNTEKVELPETTVDLMAVAYFTSGQPQAGTAKILVTVFGRP